jgi:cytochrome c oxidase subunit 2
MVTTFWFQPIKKGKFEIACSALCGNGHYKMHGNLTVESKEDFQAWLQSLSSSEDDVWADSGSGSGATAESWGWKWQAKN